MEIMTARALRLAAYLALALILLLAAPDVRAVNVQTEFDPDVDFSRFGTYTRLCLA